MSLAVRSPHAQAPGPVAEGLPTPAARTGVRLQLPHGLVSGRFAAAIALSLAVGLVVLLAINTSLAGGAITLSGLESTLARKTEQLQASAGSVEALASPASLQQSAIELGMVPAAAPAFLDLETGMVTGDMTPAVAPPEPLALAPQVDPTDPKPEQVVPSASASASAGPPHITGSGSAVPESSSASAPAPAPPPAPAPVPDQAAVPSPSLPTDPGTDGARLTIGPGTPAPSVAPPQPAEPSGEAPPEAGQSGDSATIRSGDAP